MNPRPQTIPVLLLVKTAFQLLWQQRDDALRLGLAPALLLFGGFVYANDGLLAVFGLMQGGMPSEMPVGLGMQLLVFALVDIAAISLAMVNWLRFLLLGPMSAVGLGLAVGRPHVRFLLAGIAFSVPASFALAALVLPLAHLPSVLAGLAILVLCIGVVVFIARMLPFMAALAIGQPMTLAQSWTVSRGNGFVVAVSLFLTQLPFSLGMEMLQRFLAIIGFAKLAPAGTLFIVSVVTIAAWICQAGVLATAYRHMVGVRV